MTTASPASLLPVHHDALHGTVGALHQAGDGADRQPRARGERRPHHGAGEGGGVYLGRGLGGAKTGMHRRVARKPIGRRQLAVEAHIAARAGHDTERIEAAVSPFVVDPLSKLGVQVEAAPCQRLGGRAIAPVEGQEPARLARGRVGDTGALDHHGLDAALAEEVGDRRADHAAPADQHAHARLATAVLDRIVIDIVIDTASPIGPAKLSLAPPPSQLQRRGRPLQSAPF